MFQGDLLYIPRGWVHAARTAESGPSMHLTITPDSTATSLASALAYLFPEHVQAYYDTVLEPPFLAGASHLKSISAAAPSPVVGAIVFGFDLALGAGFFAYALAPHATVLAFTLAAIGVGAAVFNTRRRAAEPRKG